MGPKPWLRGRGQLVPKLIQPTYDLIIDFPDGSWMLVNGLRRGIVEDLTASLAMSSQALNNLDLQRRMLALLLGNFNLWEGLREKAAVE